MTVLPGADPQTFVLEYDQATGADARDGDLRFRAGEPVSAEEESR